MINKFEQSLKLNQKSGKTIESYLKQVKPYLKFCKDKPSQKTLDDFILQKIENNLASSSINLFTNAMKSYCQYLNIILEFPKQKGRKPSKNVTEPYWTEEQLNDNIISMLNLIFRDGQSVEDLLKFMFYTGLRPMEICNIEKSDIDFEKENIIIKNGKGNKDRIIPFINEWIKEFLSRQSDGKLFNMTYQTLGNKFNKIRKELNLEYKVTPYIMRKSFAKYLLSRGLDIAYIQRLLGHEDIKTTMIYVQPDDDMVKDAVQKMRR